MIKVTEFAFVGYPVTDEARARAFYEGLLKLESNGAVFRNEEGFWFEYQVGPHTLALASYWKADGKSGPCLALEMENYDETVAALKKAGVVFDMETYESPVCYTCVVRDPDGNQLMIHKRKPGRD
jgi:predicted enzyme related to lactoylglutathione lyase